MIDGGQDVGDPSGHLQAIVIGRQLRGAVREVLTRDFTTMSSLVNEVPVYAATIPWGPPFDPSVAPALRSTSSPRT